MTPDEIAIMLLRDRLKELRQVEEPLRKRIQHLEEQISIACKARQLRIANAAKESSP